MAIQQRNMNKVNDTHDTDSLLKKPAKKKILSWNEIPAWMQDNVYITGGYRPQTNSYVGCLKTLLYLHNESGKSILCSSTTGKVQLMIIHVQSIFIVTCWRIFYLSILAFISYGLNPSKQHLQCSITPTFSCLSLVP